MTPYSPHLDELTRPKVDPRLVLLTIFSSILGGACLGAMVITYPSSLPKDMVMLSLFLGMIMHALVGLVGFARSNMPGACFFVFLLTGVGTAAIPRAVTNRVCDQRSAVACYAVDRVGDGQAIDRPACLNQRDARACSRILDLDSAHAAAYCGTWLDVENTREAHLRCDHVLSSSLETTQARMAMLHVSADAGDDASLNSLAWLYATSPHSSLRNGERAIRLSRMSLEKKPDEHLYIDTLAAAYAEVGRYDDAIKTQKRALELVPSWQPRNDYELRLALYEAHKPARD